MTSDGDAPAAPSSGATDDDDARPVIEAADAATAASRDATEVARSAAGTASTAHDAATAAEETSAHARRAMSMTVAAAASAAAETAARAAAEVRAHMAGSVLDLGASTVAVVERIAADLPDDVGRDDARHVARLVAAEVAADVAAQVHLAEDAAARVARAVTLAAEAAALAALSAAAIVKESALAAESSAHHVAGASLATAEGSDRAVASAARVAELAMRRVALLTRAPLVGELRRALERDELRLHYQPMYRMVTGDVVAVEALIRWEHPTRGLLLPGDFLDVAEGPHLVMDVGDWVLQTAVAQAADWWAVLGDRAPTMWVNISCEQLGRRHLVQVVERLLAAAGLPPWSLGIEITERQLARNVDDVATDLVALRDLGVGLAVDDFGTGYASLDYLRRFVFDEVKIDRSFVAALPDRVDTAVTSSIIALGTSLGLTVVAEGVETQEQRDQLEEMGCTLAQGYLFHAPAPAEVIAELLTRGP